MARAPSLSLCLGALVGAVGCDAVFGLELRDDAAVDAAADADAEVPWPPQVTPACWGDDGYLPYGTLPSSRYRTDETFRSWDDARAGCMAQGAHLAVLADRASEWAQLTGWTNVSELWLGLTDQGDEGQFRAITGEPLDELPWASGEPNNASSGDGEDCVRLNTAAAVGGVLNDAPCELDHQSLCECTLDVTCSTPPGSMYTLAGPFTWGEAQAACRARGDELASFGTAADLWAQVVVLRTMSLPHDGFMWIDARDERVEGDWRASSGCQPYLRWGMPPAQAPEPDGASQQNCAALSRTGMVDAACEARTFGALCVGTTPP